MPLPIPLGRPSATTYGMLNGIHADLVQDLTRTCRSDTPCHVDPDLDPLLLDRLPGWRGAFGQVDAALSHLRSQGVSPGDLFLFWGSYRMVTRPAGKWSFTGPTVHVMFGWLQVGSCHDLGPDGSHILSSKPWLRDHPHARPGWGRSNAIYIASDRLAMPGLRAIAPGSGLLPRGYRLTAPGANPSVWTVPAWLHPALGGVGMTYHGDAKRWSPAGTVQCVAQGQEFVADIGNDPRAGEWLSSVFDTQTVAYEADSQDSPV